MEVFNALLRSLQSNPRLDGSTALAGFEALFPQLQNPGPKGSLNPFILETLLIPLKIRPAKTHLDRCDLSSLINNDALPRTMAIEHGLSGTRWKLNEKILSIMYPSMTAEKLKTTIKFSGLPLESINVFIDYLFHKTIHHTDTRTLTRYLLHSIHLSDEIGLPWDHLQSQLLSAVSGFNGDDASLAVIDAWNDEHICWSNDEEPMNYLIAIIKQKWQSNFVHIASAMPTKKMMMLLTHVLTCVEITIPTAVSKLPGLPAVEVTCTTTSNVKDLVVPLSEFAFVVDSHKSILNVFKVNSFYLYPRWSYFRRILDSKLHESKSRMALLAPHYTVNIVSALLESLFSVFKTALSEEECMIVLEYAGELELVDASGVPVAPFESLMSYCDRMCFPPQNDSNLIHLLSRHFRLGHDAKVKELIYLVFESPRAYSVIDFLSLFDIELCTLLFAELKRRDTLHAAWTPPKAKAASKS